ncbi:acyltransferase family protein [Microlunatus soli]|nr:acyltransferase family protein [Microlunatus soli]
MPVASSIPAAEREQNGRQRMFFIDNLRVWLTALVILHHLAITFGRSGPWYYLVPNSPEAATLGSLVFLLINQAYFMGLFFGVSAYFTPGSVDRKGVGQFIRDRALRLGVPLVLFVFVLGPVAALHGQLVTTGHYTFADYLSSIGFGPLWFVEVLIIFTAIYLAVRRGRPAPSPWDQTLRGRSVIIFGVGLVLTTYLFRFILPLSSPVPYLEIASGYEIPQYAAFFVVGILAYRRGWLRNLPSRFGIVGGIVAVGATIVLSPVLITGVEQATQRGTWQSAVYALWEQTFAIGCCLALLVFFRRFVNRQGPIAAELARSAFPAYVVHAPVITWLAVAMAPLGLNAVLGFVVAAVLGIPLTFAVAAGVRRLPGLRHVF